MENEKLVRVNFYLSIAEKEFLQEQSSQRGMKLTAIIREAIQNYADRGKNNKELAAEIVAAFEAKYGNTFTRIRLGTNEADRNSQVLIEMMNTLFENQGVRLAVPTSVLMNPAVQGCKDEIKERVAYNKQRKDNKPKKAGDE